MKEIQEFEIENLTRDEMLDSDFIPSIFNNYPDDNERNIILKEVLIVARKNRILTKVKNNLTEYEHEKMLSEINDNALVYMKITGKKQDDTTIENYVQAILNIDDIKEHILFNEFTGKFERIKKDGRIRNWTDDDDAWVLNTIENTFNIYDKKKYRDALLLCKDEFAYHPIKNKIESIEWDGKKRIDGFLANIMKCDDGVYAREVSRMIFYGGIARIYNPGVKFDYMPILVGEQGTCKSTIVDWLSMDTNSYKEIMEIDNKDGWEVLRYGWVCEFSELLAMIKNRMVESMKAFISRQVDVYRSPYAININDFPRHCIFIGTTNNFNFLIDKTGNRRFLPIVVNSERGELYEKEEEVKKYIEQCWAEAKVLFDNNEIYLTIPKEYNSIVEEEVNRFAEDDPQQGMVEEYLRDKPVGYKVCVIEIYTKALNNLQKRCSRIDSINIGNYMRKFPNWKMGKTNKRFKDYGTQRYWEKTYEIRKGGNYYD